MNPKWAWVVDECERLLAGLYGSSERHWGDFRGVPGSGIYLLLEEGKPVYAGRSNRLRHRLQEHGQESSSHYSAPFAFILAKEAAAQEEFALSGRRRAELEADPRFRQLFDDAKGRVRGMTHKAVEVSDQTVQTVLEVLAHLEFETRYNDFGTH